LAIAWSGRAAICSIAKLLDGRMVIVENRNNAHVHYLGGSSVTAAAHSPFSKFEAAAN
jgi:hypothetical protein